MRSNGTSGLRAVPGIEIRLGRDMVSDGLNLNLPQICYSAGHPDHIGETTGTTTLSHDGKPVAAADTPGLATLHLALDGRHNTSKSRPIKAD
jgi:hypothetical protein